MTQIKIILQLQQFLYGPQRCCMIRKGSCGFICLLSFLLMLLIFIIELSYNHCCPANQLSLKDAVNTAGHQGLLTAPRTQATTNV
jgi:hypothetical protein